MNSSLNIDSYHLTPNSPVFIVAEMSCNHRQDIEVALETVRAARRAGADAIKVQTFTPDTITLDSNTPPFMISGGTPWDGKSLFELYAEAALPWTWHEAIQREAQQHGLVFFSSPFDHSAIDFLSTLDVPAYKIASFEIHDLKLIRYAAKRMKPMIISTGIATLEEIHQAVSACREVGNDQIILLKCTSAYPAQLSECNLRNIVSLSETFGVYTGLSDHTLGSLAPIVATSLGARVIEKHLILRRDLGGPDASFSLTEEEFRTMVLDVRNAESTLGSLSYVLPESASTSRRFGRSLFAVLDIKQNQLITEQMIGSFRPGIGISARHFDEVIGKRAKRDIQRGSPLEWGILE